PLIPFVPDLLALGCASRVADDAEGDHLGASFLFPVLRAVFLSGFQALEERLLDVAADLGPVLDGRGPVTDCSAVAAQAGLAGDGVQGVADATGLVFTILEVQLLGLESDEREADLLAGFRPLLERLVESLDVRAGRNVVDASGGSLVRAGQLGDLVAI